VQDWWKIELEVTPHRESSLSYKVTFFHDRNSFLRKSKVVCASIISRVDWFTNSQGL